MEERKERKKVLAGYFSCLLKIGGLIQFFLQMLLSQSSGYDQRRHCYGVKIIDSKVMLWILNETTSSLRKRLRICSVISVNYHYITVLCPFNLLIRFKCYNTVSSKFKQI